MVTFPATSGLDTTGKVQMDLAILALACGLTPVVSLQYSQTGCPETFPFINPMGMVTDVLHGWVHNDKGKPEYTEMWRTVLSWFAEQFAYFIGRMKSINEGGRSLLDSSAIVITSSFGHAGGHSPANLPFVIAGSCGGAFKTGRFLDYSTEKPAHNRLLLGVARAFGLELPSFGNPKYGTAPLPELFTA
jgi:hypothetical protein